MISIFKIKNYIFLVFLLAITNRLAIAHSVSFLKPINSILFITLLCFSILDFQRLIKFMKLNKIKLILIILFIYPAIMIFFDLAQNFSFSKFTDAYLITFPYYALSFIAIPFAIFIKYQEDFFGVYFKTNMAIIIFSLFFLIPIYSFMAFGDAYSLLDNCILPLSFFSFSKIKKHKIIGFIFLSIGVFYVSIIASRSYFLVFTYLVLLLAITYLKSEIRIVKSLLIAFVVFLIFSNTNVFSKFTDSPLFEKIKIESLINVISSDRNTISSINDYAEDSRTKIIQDAFKDFTLKNYLFGKGIFSKYESFTERNTIEIGWLQQGYWFGFIFVILALFIFLRSAILCIRNKNPVYNFFGFIIIIKTLDSFIYGMPTVSVYSFLVFIGLFLPYIKNFKLEKYIVINQGA
ncbi:hypothetical protein [Mariniflexile sp.]|uniref:hypothetical protein n=1 Tax=Mariniflexile sp. TaxID=1979402 RepID=UPI003563927A